MLRSLFCIVFLFTGAVSNAQNKDRIELTLSGRYDRHADYTTRFFDRSYTNNTQLSGMSYGLAFTYVHPVRKQLQLSFGAGYYSLGIDRVHQSTPFGIIAKARSTNYTEDSTLVLRSTGKYHYNNLMLSTGIVFENPSSTKLHIITGADCVYLYTFSQYYDLGHNHPPYKTSNNKTLGLAVNAFAGVVRKFRNSRYYLSPKLIIPVYQSLNGDEVFGEDQSVHLSKWFNGIGLSVALGKYL